MEIFELAPDMGLFRDLKADLNPLLHRVSDRMHICFRVEVYITNFKIIFPNVLAGEDRVPF